MLQEIKNVKQERGPGRRRWFESEGLELVVWFDGADRISGFQLCYDLGHGERALTWRHDNGFVHTGIDQGDESPLKNRTPILGAPQLEPPSALVVTMFDERSVGLDPAIRRLVHDRLSEYVVPSARP